MFSKAIKTSVTDKTTGITTATIKFTAKQVEEELSGEKFNDITKNTPIYLHAIFRTYVVKGTKETDIETNIKNWKDILLAKWWDRKDDKLEEFAKYYNMRIEFQPAKQENNTLYHYIDDINKPIETKHLISAKPEEIISWSDEPAEKSYKNKKYELYKYVVENKKGEVLETHFIGDSHSGKPSCNIENIRSGKAKVVFGGLKIKLYYKEKEGANILIRAVNQKTNTVIKNKLYEGYVIRGEDFNKEIDTVIEDNNKIYNKSINFSYEYKNNKNISKTKLFKTTEPGDPIKFTIPSDIQNSSTIIVTVYYNEKAPSPIPVTVKAIKKDTNDEIKTYTTNTVNGGEQYSFTAEDPIQIGSKKYEFTGDWKWQFKKSISSYPIITDYGNGPNISFKAPTEDEIKDGITVYVYYREKDTKEDEINLRVIMVSRIGALIKEISTEKVTRGQDISKDIESIKAVNRFAYKYISKWDYTYTTASGDTTKSGSGGTASFKVSTNTKLGTVITLRLYYELEHKEEPLIEEQSISIDIDNPSPYARIDGDKYGANYFFSKDGISTTESQHVYVKAKDYLLGYTLVNRTGTVKFTVPVKMIYTLNFNSSTPKEHDGPIQVIDKVTDEQVIIVEKAYSYWEIEKLEYYIISSANVYNYSIPNGGVSLSAGTINVPNLITRHSSEPEDHIILPKEHYDGIELTYELPPAEERPQIEFQDLTAYALEMTGELKVKNDYLVFNGDTVLSDAISEKIAPYPITTSLVQSNRIIDDKILYTEGQIIDALKRNGVYQSNGNVTYTRHPMSVNADQNYKIFDMPVNHVTIRSYVIP